MIPNKDLFLNPKKTFNKLKELLDNYRKNIDTRDKFYYEYLLEDIRKTYFWNISCSSNKTCIHEYKHGKNKGEICGAKVFIKSNNRLQEYLCSRHCRDYTTKSRKYSINNIRCSYIRKNNKQCKHRCEKNNIYC